MGFPFEYREHIPDGALGRAVASVWYARGRVPYRRERIAPTGSTVAVVVLGDPIIETAGGSRSVPLRAERGFMIGPHDRPVTNEPTGETFAVGVVTTPVGARAALGVEPAAIAGQVVDLGSRWAPAPGLRSELVRTTEPEAMLERVLATLASGLALDAVAGLDRCEQAVAMLAADPVRPIADVAATLGISHGHLDREFTRIVGLAPRRLARLLRVERLIAALPLDGPVPWADLAAELGWSDQSHLIRDVRRHTGSTPNAYLDAQRRLAATAGDGGVGQPGRFVPEPM